MHDNESVIKNNSKQYEWRSLGIHCYVKFAILAALFIGLFRNEIFSTIYVWINDSSWSHGFLIPLFSLYFINQNKKEILSTPVKPSYFGLLMLVLCIGIYVVDDVMFRYAYVLALLMLASLGSVVLFQCGWRLVNYLWLPVCYLFFAIPLPDRLYRRATIPMRELAAQAAATVLSWVPDLEAVNKGVIIDIIYKGKAFEPALDVAEACSGMRLLMAFVALGVAMAYLHYRPIWQRIILLLSTIPIAILCNMVRVTVTGLIYVLIDPKYAQGVYHDMLGMMMLPLAFVLYGVLAWFLSSLFVEEEDRPQEDIIVRKR